MSAQVQCPNPQCRKASALPDEFRGKSVRCRHCQTKFRVPLQPEAPPASAVETTEYKATQDNQAPPRSPAVDFPQQIGRFAVRCRLGGGAFGMVYRAWDEQLNREVAVKVLHSSLRDRPRIIERFQREARALAGLRHPHIVPVYDVGSDAGMHYMAAGLIKGKTLGERVDAKDLSWEESAQIVRKLAEALAYAHGRGIVHRDVKPDNVLLDEKGQPYLVDFGLAVQQEEAEKLTQAGAIVGTPAYMPPEHAEGMPAEPKPASDQYSLGVVLYELLTGKTPFYGPPAIVLHNILHQEPAAPRTIRTDIPVELETICLKAMARQPEQRYAGCQELADDLRRWLEGEPIRAKQLSLGQRLVRWGRRRPALVALTGLTVVCLVLTAVVASVSAARLAASRAEAASLAEQAKREAARANQTREEAKGLALKAQQDEDKTRKDETQVKLDALQVLQETAKAKDAEKQQTEALQQGVAKEDAGRAELYKAHLRLAQHALERAGSFPGPGMAGPAASAAWTA